MIPARIIVAGLVVGFLLGTVERARGQMLLLGGNPQLALTSGTPGGTMIPVVNTSTRIFWFRQAVTTKITVSTSCPGQHFSLSVFATAVSSGNPAPEVTLTDGMPDVDLIVGIPAGGGMIKSCTLRYTASATFAQGNSAELGNDMHSVMYTLLAQ